MQSMFRNQRAPALALCLASFAAAKSTVVIGQGKGPWYGYPYGGTTSGESSADRRVESMTFHGDDREYSGWTVGFDTLHLARIRRTGGITFRIRGARGGERLTAGLIDDESDGKDRKVQVRLDLSRYATLDTAWRKVSIPFSDWSDDGMWWDPKMRREIQGQFDWDRVVEFRLSSDPGRNSRQSAPDHRYTVEFGDLEVVDSMDHFDRDAYWKAFRSIAPDRVVADPREPSAPGLWRIDHDPETRLDTGWTIEGGRGRLLELRYRLQGWAQILASAERLPADRRDWSKHRSIALDLWTGRSSSSVKIGIVDAGGENWTATATASKGWNHLVVPFREFELDPWWQPPGALANRVLDLDGIRAFLVQPLDRGLSGTLRIGAITLTNSGGDLPAAAARPGQIMTNQVGYLPFAPKRFLVSGMGARKGWALLDSSGRAARQGNLSPQGFWAASEDSLRLGDFSGWTRPGRYRIAVGDSQGPEILISDTAYRAISKASLRAYWYQRCGADLPADLAGPWARKAGHPDTALPVAEVPGRKGKLDVHGGWYDAGDYGKYVVNAGITLGNLLSIQETWPDAFPDRSLSIPESGNGISDLLDQARWEIEWFFRMQDKDGGVFFKVGSKSWDGFVEPAAASLPRFVFGKSTTSTLDAAAVFAQASRVWKRIDPAFSRECLARAERGWKWAGSRPFTGAPLDEGGTGSYSDFRATDERFWAACELWLSTGGAEYRSLAASLSDSVDLSPSAWWQDVGDMGWFSLARLGKDDPLALTARAKIASGADTILARIEGSPGRIPDETFPWGSNDRELQGAVTLIQAWLRDPRDSYRDGALEILDYVLGRNPMEVSFVTGFGRGSPNRIHARIPRGQGTPPFPGFLVSGPDGAHDDDLTKDPSGVRWNGEPPARSWKDEWRSYATNEVAINWNSSLAYVLAWADRLGRRPGQ